MQVSRWHLLIAVVAILVLATASAFAVNRTFIAFGPNAVDASVPTPSTAIRVSTMNRSNPVDFLGYATTFVPPTTTGGGGTIFDIVNLGDATPGDATFSVKVVRVPTSSFPSDFCAIRWVNSATPTKFDILVDRSQAAGATGQYTQTLIASATRGLDPVISTDPKQYTFGMRYIPTSATQGRIQVQVTESRPGAPFFALSSNVLYDDTGFNSAGAAGTPASAVAPAFEPGVGVGTVTIPAAARGTGYAAGNRVYIPTTAVGGTPAVLRVDTVNATGGVTALVILERGTGYTVANNNPTVALTGAGTGLQVNVTALQGRSGVRWISGSAVDLKQYAELRNSAAVTPGVTSFVDTVNFTDTPVFDTATIAAQVAPTTLLWNEQGTPRSVIAITATNSGSRTWTQPASTAPNNPGRLRIANAIPDKGAASVPSVQVKRDPFGTAKYWWWFTNPTGPVTGPTVLNLDAHTVPIQGNVAANTTTAPAIFQLHAPNKTGRWTNTFVIQNDIRQRLGTNPTGAAQWVFFPNSDLKVDVSIDTSRFSDMLLASNFRRHVETLAASGVTLGTTATTYSPNDVVTRRQMAAFIGRSLRFMRIPAYGFTDSFATFHAITPTTQSFDDVGLADPLADWIYAISEPAWSAGDSGVPAAHLGDTPITLGCDADSYCPDAAVTRVQMAAFIRRAFGIPLANPATPSFTDVLLANPPAVPIDATHFATELFQSVEGIASLVVTPPQVYPVTRGCTATTFCPNDNVTRLQMAIFLIRAGIHPLPEYPTSSTNANNVDFPYIND